MYLLVNSDKACKYWSNAVCFLGMYNIISSDFVILPFQCCYACNTVYYTYSLFYQFIKLLVHVLVNDYFKCLWFVCLFVWTNQIWQRNVHLHRMMLKVVMSWNKFRFIWILCLFPPWFIDTPKLKKYDTDVNGLG